MTHHAKIPSTNLSAADLNTSVNHEPRIRDLTIAERLGMADPHDIRRLIADNQAELEMHGEVFRAAPGNSGKRGRPGKGDYWLTEGQCLVICALSRTPNAAAIRKEVIEVYMAWRRGQLPPPAEAPAPKLSVRDLNHLRLLVAECRKVYGPKAADRLWRDLGIPGAPAAGPAQPELSLPAPALREAVGMIVLGGQVVTFDAADWKPIGRHDCVVLTERETFVSAITRPEGGSGQRSILTSLRAVGPFAAVGTVLGRVVDVQPLALEDRR